MGPGSIGVGRDCGSGGWGWGWKGDKLDSVVAPHAQWLHSGGAAGRQADFEDADLRQADLRGADQLRDVHRRELERAELGCRAATRSFGASR